MEDKSQEFLSNYINNASPSGHEASGQKIWLDYIKPYIDDYMVDTYGSVAAIKNPGKPYKIVLEAHADQVSYVINYISKDGYIYVAKNGGATPVIAPSKKVNIHTEKGIVTGVFGWPAPHVNNSKKDTPELENLYIDTGCSSEEELAELGVEVGCVVTFDDKLTVLNNKLYCGPGLDNGIGGFILAEVVRRLHINKVSLPFGLYLVNSVQEEVGKNGAVVMANNIKPDVAIIADVTHDTQSPMYDKKTMGDIKIGKGPVLTYSPTVQKNLLKMLLKVATGNKIPFQKKAASKSTGTDADAFAFADSGIPSALVSIPLKYMHTTVEAAHKSDVEWAIQLLYEFLLQLKA